MLVQSLESFEKNVAPGPAPVPATAEAVWAEFVSNLSPDDRSRLLEAELDFKESRIEMARRQLNHEAVICDLQRKYRICKR